MEDFWSLVLQQELSRRSQVSFALFLLRSTSSFLFWPCFIPFFYSQPSSSQELWSRGRILGGDDDQGARKGRGDMGHASQMVQGEKDYSNCLWSYLWWIGSDAKGTWRFASQKDLWVWRHLDRKECSKLWGEMVLTLTLASLSHSIFRFVVLVLSTSLSQGVKLVSESRLIQNTLQPLARSCSWKGEFGPINALFFSLLLVNK